MNNKGQRESIESGYDAMRLIIWCIAAAAMVFAQFRAHSLGKLGTDCIYLGAGALIMLATLLDFHSSTSILSFSKFRRSDDSTGFWASVSISGLLGAMLVFGALGDLYGLWQF